MAYDKGDLVRVAVLFENDSEVATDPTAITFNWKIGKTGSTTTYTYGVNVELVKDSVGNYHVDLTINSDNTTYYVGFYGTGTIVAADENLFHVNKSYFS